MITKMRACMMRKSMNVDRRRVIAEIKALITPHLHASGYVDTQLCHWGNYGESSAREGEARGYTCEALNMAMQGFTQDGIITDAYCAIATCNYQALNLNELLWVYGIAVKHHEKLI